jgi:hypothetical protein
MTIRLHHDMSVANRHKTKVAREPTRSITEFAQMKNMHRETIATRARKFPLPAARYEVVKCGRVVPYYLLSELEQWHSEWCKSHGVLNNAPK